MKSPLPARNIKAYTASPEEKAANELLDTAHKLQEEHAAKGKKLDVREAIMMISRDREQKAAKANPPAAFEKQSSPNPGDVAALARTIMAERAAVEMPVTLTDAVNMAEDRLRQTNQASAQVAASAQVRAGSFISPETERAVAAAISSGKVTENNRAWAVAAYQRSPSQFDAFLKAAPVLN